MAGHPIYNDEIGFSNGKISAEMAFVSFLYRVMSPIWTLDSQKKLEIPDRIEGQKSLSDFYFSWAFFP